MKGVFTFKLPPRSCIFYLRSNPIFVSKTGYRHCFTQPKLAHLTESMQSIAFQMDTSDIPTRLKSVRH